MDPDKLVAFAADNQSFIITPKKSEVILLPAGYIYVHVAMNAQYFRWSTLSDVNDGVIQAKDTCERITSAYPEKMKRTSYPRWIKTLQQVAAL